MATKLNFQYGQWKDDAGLQLSIKTPGLIVFNGQKNEIYLDGKIFGASESQIQELIDRVTTLEEFREALRVEGYEQATIVGTAGDVPAADASILTIFGIKQGEGEEGENDGKIYHDSAKDLVVNIAGEYRPEETGEGDDKRSRNWLATEETVSNAVGTLRAEIFGTLDPEELDKTIDSIKEIQEMLKGGDFVTLTHDVINPETGEYETKVDNVRVLPVKDEDGNILSYNLPLLDEDGKPVKDEDGNLVPDPDKVVVTFDEDGKPVYDKGTDESGRPYEYGNLQHTENVQELLKDIDNIEKKNLVAEIIVDENKANDFVAPTTEPTTDEHGLTTQVVTIGVNYGTFKTEHEEVHNEESKAYVDGIATVKDVQEYIERRMTWVSYETSIEEGVELTSGSTITNEPADANVLITLPEDGTMKVKNPIGTDKPIVVR